GSAADATNPTVKQVTRPRRRSIRLVTLMAPRRLPTSIRNDQRPRQPNLRLAQTCATDRRKMRHVTTAYGRRSPTGTLPKKDCAARPDSRDETGPMVPLLALARMVGIVS